MAKRSTCVSMGCPLATYIKEGREEVAVPRGARQVWGILLGLPSPSRIPLLFPIPSRRRTEGGRGEKEGGGRRPLLVQFGPGGRRRAAHLCLPLSLSTKAHMAHYFSRGGSGNPPALRFSPKSLGTLPVSEYSRPIYQSLCLDHFETPRHVRDHIRDSKLTSVHQNA